MKAQKHISALLITLLTVSAMSGMAPPVYADEAPSLSYDGYKSCDRSCTDHVADHALIP